MTSRRPPRQLSPDGMATPAAAYAHGVHVEAGTELVYTSGVVPTRLDGTVPESIGEQAQLIWKNIEMILAEAQMTFGNIISITTYVVAADDLTQRLRATMTARDAALGGHRAASTLVTVAALARAEWQIEIAVIAAK